MGYELDQQEDSNWKLFYGDWNCVNVMLWETPSLHGAKYLICHGQLFKLELCSKLCLTCSKLKHFDMKCRLVEFRASLCLEGGKRLML